MEKYCRAGQVTDDNIIWHICIACWITKATNAHSEYVILFASSLQQWLHEHSSVLHYTYITRLLVVVIVPLYVIWDVDLSSIFPPSGACTMYLWGGSSHVVDSVSPSECDGWKC